MSVSEVGEEKIRERMICALSEERRLKVAMACFMFLLRVSMGGDVIIDGERFFFIILI